MKVLSHKHYLLSRDRETGLRCLWFATAEICIKAEMWRCKKCQKDNFDGKCALISSNEPYISTLIGSGFHGCRKGRKIIVKGL